MGSYEVINGDCLDVMRGMASASVDAVVCDPPYMLGFMGKAFDRPKDNPAGSVETWAEVYRLLKDGGRLLAFGGPRTYHRMTCAIEDAGFLIEDCIMWIFGQGFPKHKSKLKPAYEPIVVARKGGASHLQIDACRIETNGESIPHFATTSNRKFSGRSDEHKVTSLGARPAGVGRWPANVILDEEAGRVLDGQSGPRGDLVGAERKARQLPSPTTKHAYGEYVSRSTIGYSDSGGASRFFYCAKSSRAERNAGLEGMPERAQGQRYGTVQDARPHTREGYKYPRRATQNTHPTVKPISLMRYLCRLVTPPNGTILDPFCGSGSTGIAAIREGFNFIGIEQDRGYCEIAEARIKRAQGIPCDIPRPIKAERHLPLFAENVA